MPAEHLSYLNYDFGFSGSNQKTLNIDIDLTIAIQTDNFYRGISMWDRTILKSNAKIALTGRYWVAFAVSLLTSLLGGGYSLLTKRIHMAWTLPPYGDILLMIFVSMPFVIGTCRFFLHNHFGVTDFGTVFSGFQLNYLNGVGAMFVTNLLIGLWSLLLVIPGIIKALEYTMVPFLLADNPSLPGSRAREISHMMTYGEKWNILVLEFSFLGWFLLGALCLGVGILFVIPYFNATMTELYIYLRDRAIQANMLNPAELGLVQPAPEYRQPYQY
jgi:hypothetical protein